MLKNKHNLICIRDTMNIYCCMYSYICMNMHSICKQILYYVFVFIGNCIMNIDVQYLYFLYPYPKKCHSPKLNFHVTKLQNFKHYGQDEPPTYNLSRVTTKTAIFIGEADDLATMPDAQKLATLLPNVIHIEKLKFPGLILIK